MCLVVLQLACKEGVFCSTGDNAILRTNFLPQSWTLKLTERSDDRKCVCCSQANRELARIKKIIPGERTTSLKWRRRGKGEGNNASFVGYSLSSECFAAYFCACTSDRINRISKIQLMVYYQCCVLIG